VDDAPVPEPLDRLAFLVGDLGGPEEVGSTRWAPAGAATAAVQGALHLDGRLLVQHQTQERDGAVAFRAVNVFMADPETAEVVMYSFDSTGYPPEPPARGTWQDGDLVLDRVTDRGAARTTYTPTADGYRWSKSYRPPDEDEWATLVEGRMRPTG
jgi:hypothetical protein